MKTSSLIRSALLIAISLESICFTAFGQGNVNFSTAILGGDPIGSKVTDIDDTPLSGLNFFAQLYGADGWTASQGDLHPVGIPVNFRSGPVNSGWVMNSGNNSLGQTINPTVLVTDQPGGGPVSVQMRAWSGPFTNYEGALQFGGRIGESRILRMTAAAFPNVPSKLIDADGAMRSFKLRFGVPALTINDLVVAEGTNGTVPATFNVTLTSPSTNTVTVDFITVDDTALAGSDYVATADTLTFAPGETSHTIPVTITADVDPEPDEQFHVVLSNPQNAPLQKGRGTCTITEVRIAAISVDVAVTFNTVAGHDYAVESSDDLTGQHWTLVAGAEDVSGTGNLVTIIDRGSGCLPSRLYRARLIH